MAVGATHAVEQPGNWTGDYQPCDGHAQLLSHERMVLGVRFATSNRRLAKEFARALDWWSGILDMDWHEDDSLNCAIQLVNGGARLFKHGEAARAQFPGQPSFQGWIAFNAKVPLPGDRLFVTAVHELGHLLGLPHSANPNSVMYFLSPDGPVFLDGSDLAALTARHKLRREISCRGKGTSQSPVGCGSIGVGGFGPTF